MPRYNCIKHNQIMEERIVNDRIQPYCLECKIERTINEKIQTYINNEKVYIIEHKKLVRKDFYEKVVKVAVKVFILSSLVLFPVGLLIGDVIFNSISEMFGFILPLVLTIWAFLSSLFQYKKPTTFYSKPTRESVEKEIEIEKKMESNEVRRFKEKLHKEFLIHSTRIEEVDQMDGFEFEQYVADLLRKIGFTKVELTKKTGDGGVDILAINFQGEKTAIQCKRLNSKVGFGAIQEIFMGKKRNKCKNAMVITNSYFTKPAYEAATDERIELWDRNRLLEEMRKVEPQFSWEEFVGYYYILPEGKTK